MLTPSELESLLGQPESVPDGVGQTIRRTSRSLGRRNAPRPVIGLDREQHFALEAMHQQLAHELSGHLSRLLNHTVAVELAEIGQMVGDVLFDERCSPACCVALRFDQFAEPVFLGIDAHLLRSLLDRLLGGTGDVSQTDHDRPLTEIEQRLVAHSAEAFVMAIQSTWQAVLPLRGHVAQVETNVAKLDGWRPERPVVRTKFSLEPEGQPSRVCLAIGLADVIQLLDRLADTGRAAPDNSNAANLQGGDDTAASLGSDTVECVLLLTETRMSAGELQHLAVGDVILTDRPSADGMTLRCGDGTSRNATLGQTHGQKAARIVADDSRDNMSEAAERPAGS
ncbi:MAG: FliM/FliN family flagellar motor switch protein [Planctomycetales bacterium]|nr:FliM/FliN family flagellar motor switch protein [Planctomycetales bacterium]